MLSLLLRVCFYLPCSLHADSHTLFKPRKHRLPIDPNRANRVYISLLGLRFFSVVRVINILL